VPAHAPTATATIAHAKARQLIRKCRISSL
jgi:hypothetical protein